MINQVGNAVLPVSVGKRMPVDVFPLVCLSFVLYLHLHIILFAKDT